MVNRVRSQEVEFHPEGRRCAARAESEQDVVGHAGVERDDQKECAQDTG